MGFDGVLGVEGQSLVPSSSCNLRRVRIHDTLHMSVLI